MDKLSLYLNDRASDSVIITLNKYVWDMTYYQFTKMFLEYRMGRQADINDMIAANSFSFKNSKDYKPMEYMNKIK